MPVAIVTGANRGLGLETVHALARRGYRVWLTGRDADSTDRAAASLQAEKLDVQAAVLDIANQATVRAFSRRLEGEPEIAALVNNAAISLHGFDTQVASTTLDNNYRGAVRVTDALGDYLAPDANIVMVSSGMGELSNFSASLQKRLLADALTRAQIEDVAQEFVAAVASGTHTSAGFPTNAYSVSKALLNAFTRVLAREFAGTSRRVNAVCTGWVKTRMGGSSAPRSLAEGACGIIWAATLSGQLSPNAGFFRDGKPIPW